MAVKWQPQPNYASQSPASTFSGFSLRLNIGIGFFFSKYSNYQYGAFATESVHRHRIPCIRAVLEKGYINVTPILLERGEDVRTQDKYTLTPLHCASYW